MSIYVLVHYHTNRVFHGDTIAETIGRVTEVGYNSERRRLTYNGWEDTVSYSTELEGDDLKAAIKSRTLDMLKSYGWNLYVRYDQKLWKMNTEMIQKLRRRLLRPIKNWEKIPVGVVDRPMDDYFTYKRECGTVGCIAGETLLMQAKLHRDQYKFDIFGELMRRLHTSNSQSLLEKAAQICDFPDHRLYHLVKWPNDLREKYRKARTLKEERHVLVEALDRYVECVENPDLEFINENLR